MAAQNIAQLAAVVSVQGAPRMIAVLNGVQNAIKSTQGSIGAMAINSTFAFARLNTGINATSLALAALAAAAGPLGLGKAAVSAASTWEALRITLIALTGSAEKADKKLQFIRELAVPALDTEEALAQAALQAEAFGLNLERALPIAAKISAAFQLDPQALDKAIRIMRRLAQRDIPDVELLAGLGFSRQQFEQQGIIFDRNKRLVSSAREVLDAFERIVNEKYGKILDMAAQTTASKLDTLRNRWDAVMRAIGNTLIEFLLPILNKLEQVLRRLAEGKEIQRFTRGLLFFAQHIIEVISIMIAGFLLLKRTILLVALAIEILIAILPTLGSVFANRFLRTLINLIFGAVMAFAVLTIGRNLQNLVNRQLDAIRKEFQKFEKIELPSADADWGKINDQPVLQDIERNTKKTAENTALDLRKIALGGGPLARLGITPLEFARFQRRGGREVVVRITGGRTLEEIFADLLAQALAQMERQSPLWER